MHPLTSIRRLPDEVVAQIKSSSTITSLCAVALGLIRNSLDAAASRIEIEVDFNRGNCIVEDDGVGILPSEFHEGGGLGKQYHTSKFDSETELYGNNGLFLSALKSVSLLTVSSRHRTHKSCNSVVFHRSKVMARHLPAPVHHELSRGSHGTRVMVRDLFGNLPVRVKQRAASADSKVETERLWEDLKRSVVALLLGWGRECALVVKDRAHTFSFLPSNASRYRGEALGDVSRHSFDLPFSLSLLNQSRLILNNDPKQWIPAAASSRELGIKGAISLEPSPTRQVQFISLGIRPLTAETGHNVLYEHINRLFNLSSYGQTDQDAESDGENPSPSKTGRDSPGADFTLRQLRASRKGADRWPMFVLRITIKQTEEHSGLNADISNESGLQAILDILNVMVTQWLAAHHFRPKKLHMERRQTRSPAKETPFKILSRDALDDSASSHGQPAHPTLPSTAPSAGYLRTPQKRKLSTPNDLTLRPKTAKFQDGRLPADINRSVGFSENRPTSPAESTSSTRTPCETPTKSTSSAALQDNEDIQQMQGAQDVEAMVWTDPVTGQKHLVNSRTGVLLPRKIGPTHVDRGQQSRYAFILEESKKAHASHKSKAGAQEREVPEITGGWLADVLKSWTNPVFPTAENHIPTVGFTAQFGDTNKDRSSRSSTNAIKQAFQEISPSTASRISRISLQCAKVLSQVDKKFILVQVPSDAHPGAELLVLIDQHAADERVRVEALLTALCEPPPNSAVTKGDIISRRNHVQLSTPIQFQVTPREADLFGLHAPSFADWAIVYDILPSTLDKRPRSGDTTDVDDNRATVSVKTLPTTISERCKSEPKILISLLRAEVWKLAESSGGGSGSWARTRPVMALQSDEGSRDTTSPSWLKETHTAPVELINLINSRACRSAIMFNDALSVAECEDLVKRLGGCAFPFQCAHGRPSMIPLVELPACNEGGQDTERGPSLGLQFRGANDGKPKFAQQWTRWRKEERERNRKTNEMD
ncbi:hypothetical protein P152DRAFT_401737 [Eremomyces bilateralis CBS 781.70]|uniref:MutL C-terminal dimerisation domain-containing protein n=1 Tax=Eremomyces bilateralis CBS 781.70 TaxID=1392243 RepID=A0A6G1FWD4_9PEZI|nr:uncharacterized protein P152DRAFT_401737 [Eremomyces bilateralis CBS 781.70]KAF1810205.1 hypothetical protein P152DRAFT_401737 [Eremomyces bilateralis CBS 781.70]